LRAGRRGAIERFEFAAGPSLRHGRPVPDLHGRRRHDPRRLDRQPDDQLERAGIRAQRHALCADGSSGGGLYRLDANTGAATLIGLLNIGFVFEGGLAFSPSGTAYGVNADSSDVPRLFTINLQTGAGTLVGTMSGGPHDINGLAWRGDGTLVGIDRETNALVAINPANANLSVVAPLTPTLGAAGGMAVIGGVGYFATGGPGASIVGSNELWRVNLFTGAHERVGSFAPTINGGTGIGGLAALVPEPAGVVLLAAAAAAATVCNRRRARCRAGL
jgi:hypothetical protein